MKCSHYSYRGHRISEPGLRRVKGTLLRSVIFQRDPEFGSAPERPHQAHEQGRQPAPQNRPWFPSSLSLSNPPSLLDHLRLAPLFLCICGWRNVLACLFQIQARVSNRRHFETLYATIFFWNAWPCPENNKDTPGESNRRPPHAKETSPKITPDPAFPKEAESFEVFDARPVLR
jgi:hypothetical protein